MRENYIVLPIIPYTYTVVSDSGIENAILKREWNAKLSTKMQTQFR